MAIEDTRGARKFFIVAHPTSISRELWFFLFPPIYESTKDVVSFLLFQISRCGVGK